MKQMPVHKEKPEKNGKKKKKKRLIADIQKEKMEGYAQGGIQGYAQGGIQGFKSDLSPAQNAKKSSNLTTMCIIFDGTDNLNTN